MTPLIYLELFLFIGLVMGRGVFRSSVLILSFILNFMVLPSQEKGEFGNPLGPASSNPRIIVQESDVVKDLSAFVEDPPKRRPAQSIVQDHWTLVGNLGN